MDKERLAGIIRDIKKVNQKTGKIMDDFRAVLKKLGNPVVSKEEIQELKLVQKAVRSVRVPLDQVWDMAIEARIELEGKSKKE